MSYTVRNFIKDGEKANKRQVIEVRYTHNGKAYTSTLYAFLASFGDKECTDDGAFDTGRILYVEYARCSYV